MIVGIVEDSAEKAAEIQSVIGHAGGSSVKFFTAGSLNSARRLLQAEQLDLLVLDIALPEFDYGVAVNDAGTTFLSEVIKNNRYKMPKQVIGVTGIDGIFQDAAALFGRELWSVLRYDRSSTLWAELLSAKIRHLKRLGNLDTGPPHDFDIAIVVALKSPEFDAVWDLAWGWEPADRAGDSTAYFEGRFTRLDGSIGKAVVARAPQMGMPSAASLAMKIGMHFRPRLLAMVGICAGDKSETNIGDVVAANPTWDYGSGKHSTVDEQPSFEAAPYPLTLSSRVRGILEKLEGESEVLERIRRRFPGDPPATVTKLHIGPFASGAAVVARAAMLQQVQGQHRKLLALDMEAYGVATAANELPHPQPDFLILKGVSDFADEDKGDSMRRYSAFASAQLLAHLCVECALC